MKRLLLLLFSLTLSTTIAFAYTHEEIHVLILAGGKGKRMESTTPKVLHKLNGIPLIDHVIHLAKEVKADSIAIVTSPDLKKDLLDRDINLIIQDEHLGTGNAVLSARLWFKDKNGDLFILFGDTPNIKPETLKNMQEQKKEYKAQIAVLGMRPTDPKRYGRIFVDDNGYLDRIIEYKDASREERKNNLCNSGVFLVELRYLDSLLKEIKNDNAAGEYYLTDIVKIGKDQGLKTIVVEAPEDELAGVNTQEELEQLQNKGNK